MGYDLPRAHTLRLDLSGESWAEVPAGVNELHLVSPSLQVIGDRRPLGALVTHLRLDGAPIDLTDPCLMRGFHAVEQHGNTPVRWTNGVGVVTIPPATVARLVEIEVAVVMGQQCAA